MARARAKKLNLFEVLMEQRASLFAKFHGACVDAAATEDACAVGQSVKDDYSSDSIVPI